MKFLRYTISLVILFVFLVGGIVFVKIDTILHRAINIHGSELLGVDVSIKKISLDVIKGNLQIVGLAIKNPRGFSAGDALYIPKITVVSKIPNLFRKPIVIESIIAQSPVVNFELGNKGNNITALKKAATTKVEKSDIQPSVKQVSALSETVVMVRSIVVKDIKLNADLKLIKETVDLGDLSVSGIRNGKPVPNQELVQQLLEQILAKISEKTQLNINIGGVKINVLQSPKELKKQVHNELKHYLKNTLDKILPH